MATIKLHNLSDQKLFALVKEGNDLAFDTLFSRYWEELYSTVASFLSDTSVAQDIVQNLFIKVWMRREEIKNDNIAGYLFKAAKQESLLQLRKNKISQRVLDRVTHLIFAYDTEDQVNFSQFKEHFELGLNALPEKTQEVFRMSRMEHLSNREISDQLRISIKTVEYHISNALKHLKYNLREFIPLVLLTLFV